MVTIIKRIVDVCLALSLMAALAAPLLLIALLVKLTSKGPVIYWSDRVGKANRIFSMPKFRTMRVDTPEVATHVLSDSHLWITPIGRFLRKTSLDELPQLWNIVKGEMSFVGPRPALHNQDDLISLRTQHGVEQLTPGLTGWAQVNGRDELEIPEKVAFDVEYLEHRSFLLDVKILAITFYKAFRSEGVVQTGDRNTDAARRRAA